MSTSLYHVQEKNATPQKYCFAIFSCSKPIIGLLCSLHEFRVSQAERNPQKSWRERPDWLLSAKKHYAPKRATIRNFRN
jgi:hypothetical protein